MRFQLFGLVSEDFQRTFTFDTLSFRRKQMVDIPSFMRLRRIELMA